MKKYLIFYILLILFLFYTNGFYTYFESVFYREEIIEDFGEFSVSQYPYNYDSVFLVTVDDISYYTDPYKLQSFLEYLKEKNVRPTLFVIPYHAGEKFTDNTHIVEILKEYDVEVAQHGYTHTEKEFKSRSYEEQIEMIKKGREILEKDFTIYGFRSPGFYHNFETSRALKDLGFSYESEMSIFDNFYVHYLPQIPHTRNRRVFMTHSLDPNIDVPKNAWSPQMKDFVDWWTFRKELIVNYKVEGNELYIFLSDYKEGLRITLKKDYRVHIIYEKELEYEREGNTIIL
ncbi:MAG: DUF2334 domain-containing protein [Methanomicrobia archaeon]|nr:DUF2334 domain-containing protein [Methanomicrobia archaeon]